jgi:hypothetical protein
MFEGTDSDSLALYSPVVIDAEPRDGDGAVAPRTTSSRMVIKMDSVIRENLVQRNLSGMARVETGPGWWRHGAVAVTTDSNRTP